jgi:hypothetical protein
LPRQELVAHLGFEPQGALVRRGGTSAGRLLLELIRSANERRGIKILADRSLYAVRGL